MMADQGQAYRAKNGSCEAVKDLETATLCYDISRVVLTHLGVSTLDRASSMLNQDNPLSPGDTIKRDALQYVLQPFMELEDATD